MTIRKQIKENELTIDMALDEEILPIAEENYFEDFMNDNLPEVVVLGCKFGAGTVLRKVDFTAFRTATLDHLDSLVKDGQVIILDEYFFWRDDLERKFEFIEDDE